MTETDPVVDSYIVILKEDCNFQSHISWMREQSTKYSNTSSKCEIIYEYNIVKGYSANLSGLALEDLASSADIEEIVQDGMAQADNPEPSEEELIDIDYTHEEPIDIENTIDEGETEALGLNNAPETNFVGFAPHRIHRDAPWGLARVNRRVRLPDNAQPSHITFSYGVRRPRPNAMADIYMVGNGINTGHLDFQGRARLGRNFTRDPNGPGRRGNDTHGAATIVGRRWGIAKTASVIAVKVLRDSDNTAPWTLVIAGMNWAADLAVVSRTPSVIHTSIRGSSHPGMDQAVTRIVARGVTVCVPAGDNNRPADGLSPARSPGAITVSAMNIRDARSVGANFGQVVDFFAPGEQITSAWVGSATATLRRNSTSSASAHVAGLIAYFIITEGIHRPAAILARIRQFAFEGRLSNIPEGTVNRMVWNAVRG